MSPDLRNITIEDLYKFKFVSQPRISPDGQRVAFVLTTIDERKHEYRSSIWMIPREGGEAQRLTSGPANAHTPVWSPDGRWLAFVSDREGDMTGKSEKDAKKLGKGKQQIWLLPTGGGEAHQLTFIQHGAVYPVWSPDSKRLIFLAQVGPLDEEGEDGKPLPKVRVVDRLWYRLDGVGFIYERRSHLFLVNVAGGEPVQLTDGDWDDGDPVWSPDGKYLAFTSSREEDRWRTPTPDVYVLTIEQGKAGDLRRLTDGSLACGSPAWSPDGQTIAFLGALKRRSGGHVDVYTIAASANQAAATSLTHDFEGSFQDWTNTDGDARDEHMAPPPIWSADGKTLYALAAHRGATRVYALSTAGGNAHPTTLTPGDIHVRDFSADRAGTHLGLLIGNPSRPPEVFVRATGDGGELKQLTTFNDTT